MPLDIRVSLFELYFPFYSSDTWIIFYILEKGPPDIGVYEARVNFMSIRLANISLTSVATWCETWYLCRFSKKHDFCQISENFFFPKTENHSMKILLSKYWHCSHKSPWNSLFFVIREKQPKIIHIVWGIDTTPKHEIIFSHKYLFE